MNSQKDKVKFSFNKTGASKASAQLKVILSLVILGLASALLIGLVSAAHNLDSTTVYPQLISAQCDNEDITNFTYKSVNLSVAHIGTDAICELNLTLTNNGGTANSHFTIEDVILNATNLSCEQTSQTKIECTNTTGTCLASGTDALVGLNMSSNLTDAFDTGGLCEDSGSDYRTYTWTIDTLDANNETNQTTNTTFLDQLGPMGADIIVNSSTYTVIGAGNANITYYIGESTYDLFIEINNDTGTEVNVTSCEYNSTIDNGVDKYNRTFAAASYNGSGCYKNGISITPNTYTYPSMDACDKGNNCETWNTDQMYNNVLVYYDDKEPLVTWNTPIEGGTPPTDSWFLVNVTFSDVNSNESGIDQSSVKFSNNASLQNTTSITCAPGSGYNNSITCYYNVSTSSIEQEVELTANATDNVGNENSTTITITITDSTNPTITWVSPPADSNVSGNLTLNATFTDAGQIAVGSINFISGCGGNIFFNPTGGDCNDTNPAEIISCEATWDTLSVISGDCNITAIANDTANNGVAENRSFFVTNLAIADIEDNDTEENNISIGIGDDFDMPQSLNLSVAVEDTNSSDVFVNITTAGICVGLSANQPMVYTAHDSGEGEQLFELECQVNKTLLNQSGANGQYNLTGVAYDIGTSDEANFTIFYDFERPKINFGWWETEDEQGNNITLPDYNAILDGQDILFGNNSWVDFKINATDVGSGVNEVYVEFDVTDGQNQTIYDDFMTATGGNCSGKLNLSSSGNYYVGECYLGEFNGTDISQYNQAQGANKSEPVMVINADITVEDAYGNINLPYNITIDGNVECEGFEVDQCMPATTPIIMHDIGVMGFTTIEDVEDMIEDEAGCEWGVNCTEGVDYEAADLCFLMDNATTTNFNNEGNFSDVDFSVGLAVNLSCLAEAGEIDTDVTLPTNHTLMMKMNFSGIDFNNQETVNQLAMLPDAIDVFIAPANSYNSSYIYVNTSTFEMINTSATISFYHLPFTEQPNVSHSEGALSVTVSDWQSGADDIWDGRIAGNLTFEIGGFSGYEMSDIKAPTVVIDAPVAYANLSSNMTSLNMTVNGTGTQMSNVLVYLNSNLTYNYSADQSMCTSVTEGSELFFCNVTLDTSTDGNYQVDVMAFDFGGGVAPGLNATAQRNITVDSVAPTIVLISLDNATYVNGDDFYLNFTPTDAIDNTIECGVAVEDSYVAAGNYTSGVDVGELITNPGDGTYEWYVNCTDDAGNVRTSETRILTVDGTDPQLQISSPANTSNFTTTTINVTVDALEANPENMALYMDGIVVGNQTNYSGSAPSGLSLWAGSANVFTLTNVAEGTHLLWVTANDLSENSATTENTTITIDTTAPTMSGIVAWNTTNSSTKLNVTTNEIADCFAEYGVNTSYGFTSSTTDDITNHSVIISSLTAGATYHYRWNCTDYVGHSVISSDYTFTTTIIQGVNNTTGTVVNFTKTVGGTDIPVIEMNITGNGTATLNLTTNTTGTTPSGKLSAGVYVNIEASNLTVDTMILKVYYNTSELPSNVDEDSLRIWYNNGGNWEEVTPGGVNTTATPLPYVWGELTHLSSYGIFGLQTTTPTSPSSGSSSGGILPAGTNYTIDLDVALTGTQDMKVNDVVAFTIKGEQHTAKLVSLSSESAVLDVNTETTRVTALLDRETGIDVDNDSLNDITITLNGVDSGIATMTFTKITTIGESVEQVTPITEPVTPTTPTETMEPMAPFGETVSDALGDNTTTIIIGVVLAALLIATVVVVLKKRS